MTPIGIMSVSLSLLGFWSTQTVTEFVAPTHLPFEGCVARWRRGAHPTRRLVVFAVAPILPWKPFSFSYLVNYELGFCVNRVLAVRERELEHF